MDEEKIPSGNIYLINEVIEFSPDDASINSLATGETIPLLSSAAECFLTLLEHHGELVTKNDLIYQGWEKYGLHASDSTFYQNILTLRKALRQGGLDDSVIKTIPRKGLQIPTTINVRILDKRCEQDNLNRVETPTDPPVESPPDNKEKKTAKRYSAGFIRTESIILLCILSILTGMALGYKEAPDYMTTYRQIGEIAGCQVSINGAGTTIKDYQRFITRYPADCKSRPFVYFATWQFVDRVSLIQCEAPLNKPGRNQCVSHYFLERK
jgi:DNA-binding winged helix-turn-helix (wHTH) protein